MLEGGNVDRCCWFRPLHWAKFTLLSGLTRNAFNDHWKILSEKNCRVGFANHHFVKDVIGNSSWAVT